MVHTWRAPLAGVNGRRCAHPLGSASLLMGARIDFLFSLGGLPGEPCPLGLGNPDRRAECDTPLVVEGRVREGGRSSPGW
eukprot:2284080-Pyramimonas_sp.AAC.1